MAMRMTKTIHEAQIQKKTPSFFWVGSPSASRELAAMPGMRGAISGEMMSVTGDPRVDDGEEEIKAEVDEHDRDGDDQGDALYHRVVVLVDAGDGLVPYPGQLQQRLDHQGAGDEPADGDPRRSQEGDR